MCEQLPGLSALNLSHNLMSQNITGLLQLTNIRVLVLNNTGIKWTQVDYAIYFNVACFVVSILLFAIF